jgi:addiction module HigA family antidote
MLTTKRKPATVGEILVEEYLQPMGLTQAELAEAMGVQRKHVNELCNNRRTVTAATALILARVFGNSPDFWLNVQRRSDLWEAMNNPRERERIERATPLGYRGVILVTGKGKKALICSTLAAGAGVTPATADLRSSVLNWRRRRDSNPRYAFRAYNGLANRRLQPLGHISVASICPSRGGLARECRSFTPRPTPPAASIAPRPGIRKQRNSRTGHGQRPNA